jgi:hypothetical protein
MTVRETPTLNRPGITGRDITVVVCCFEAARLPMLLECLRSVQTQTYRPAAVVVVIDGCAELAATLAERGGPEVLVPLEHNVGLSAARNAGLARVRTDWLAFLDDDAAADPEWLERLAQACEVTSAVGCGGWSAPLYDGPAPRWMPPELLWTVGCSHAGLPLRRTVVRNVFGGCALFRTDLLRRYGGFDVRLGRRGDGGQGGEEAEFCVRVTRENPGARFVHEPTAVIRHHVPRSRLRPRYVLGRCYAEGRSKGQVASMRGLTALSMESQFVLGMPSAAARHLAQGQAGAAAVLVLGVAAAAVGYLHARLLSGPAQPRVIDPREAPAPGPEAPTGAPFGSPRDATAAALRTGT